MSAVIDKIRGKKELRDSLQEEIGGLVLEAIDELASKKLEDRLICTGQVYWGKEFIVRRISMKIARPFRREGGYKFTIVYRGPTVKKDGTLSSQWGESIETVV